MADLDRLYELVPVIYRLRDADQGYPLQALLRVIAEQVTVLEQDIGQLYENWFIETCDDWVVPYIGALIGWSPAAIGDSCKPGARALARERVFASRREVANTIRLRRRKGTLSALQDIAAAVSGWPARAVEFYRLLAVTQNINYLHMDRGRTAELRDGDALQLIGSAFDEVARNVDVRRAGSARTPGRPNIAGVGVFAWRLRSYTITRAPAYCYEEVSPYSFLFSALGNDTQLFVDPEAAVDPALPMPITRSAFETREIEESTGETASGVPFYFGPGKSLMIWLGNARQPVDAAQIVPADLSDWTYRPLPGTVAVDPVLGRIALPPGQTRRPAVWVSYAYGFSADMGGGEYHRTLRAPADAVVYQVGTGATFARIGDALAQWRQDAPTHAVIEIVDSLAYAEPISADLAQGQTLQLRAADGRRPVLRMLDWQTTEPDALSIGGEAGWFTLDGVVVTGRGVQVSGNVSGVTIRHSTLVPGWGLQCDCMPKHAGEPSLEVIGASLCVTIEHSIIGAIRVERDEAKQNPLKIRISDSIVDALSEDAVALGTSGKLCADSALTLRRCTVVGQLQTHILELAENSILMGLVTVCRRQVGCVRFCYLPWGSRTPRRFECQPDLVLRAVDTLLAAGTIGQAQHDALAQEEQLRVEPEFDSLRYGNPAYCRLTLTCAPEIAAGAEGGSEMGVFHDLYQPQRLAALRQRLNEYVPAGSDVGVIFAS